MYDLQAGQQLNGQPQAQGGRLRQHQLEQHLYRQHQPQQRQYQLQQQQYELQNYLSHQQQSSQMPTRLRSRSRSRGSKSAVGGQHQLEQQHHNMTSSTSEGALAAATALANPRQQLFSSKDLIIRMLAEVFQVSRSMDGQLVWQQISSGLVPVSLFSRSTASWLNYLSNASSMDSTNSNSAMSPDSRQLLLLLQQFHQQNQRGCDRLQDLLVFQVVAHDYYSAGQSRTILNNKLTQPGTRLGLASDYFVYWKESPLGQHLSSSSMRSLQRLQAGGGGGRQHHEPRTWGLNFASINDANLFYDICSLNLVDLDFNSDYLRQFMLSSSGDQQLGSELHSEFAPPPPATQLVHLSQWQQQQQHQQRQRHQQQQQQQQQQQPMANYVHGKQPNNYWPQKQQPQYSAQQASYPAGAHLALANDQQRAGYNQAMTQSSSKSSQAQPAQQQQPVEPKRRVRSRSSTRQASKSEPEAEPELDPSGPHPKLDQVHQSSSSSNSRLPVKRVRSFSIPNTPEPLGSRLEGAERPNDNTNFDIDHHPRCLTMLNKRTQSQGKQQQPQQQREPLRLKRPERPERPPRGIYMDDQLEPEQDQQQQFAESGQLVPPIPETLPVSGPLPANNRLTQQQVTQQQPQSSKAQLWSLSPMLASRDKAAGEPAVGAFMASKAAQRRSTGIESSYIEQFNKFSQRPARLARAQYANSRNTNDFLSLDVGRNLFTAQTTTTARPPSGQQLPLQPIATRVAASTTTDDLPLDVEVRNRMLELAADCVGGERGLRARSDVGRRRSLERTSCIELSDLTAPKKNSLSPLPAESDTKSSPSDGEQDMNNNNNDNNNRSIHLPAKQQVIAQAAKLHPHQAPPVVSYETSLCWDKPSASSKLSRHRQASHSCPGTLNRCAMAASLHEPCIYSNDDAHTLHCQRHLAKESGARCHRPAACNCDASQIRPESCLSSRSPIQYGLYESDYSDSDDVSADANRHQRYGLSSMGQCDYTAGSSLCQAARPISCCSTRPVDYSSKSADLVARLRRSASGHLCEQAHLKCNHYEYRHQHQQLEPVPGYDRTMARQRPRAKSQPPRVAGSQFCAPDGSLLARSMENLRKLIKEVQLELSAIKRHQQQPGGRQMGAQAEPLACQSGSATGYTNGAAETAGERDGRALHETTSKRLNVGEPVARRSQQAGAASGAASSATKCAVQFTCVGAIRKAGFLSVKKWILRRRRSIELARKQGWKRYWVCLRGTTLLFHSVLDSRPAGCNSSSISGPVSSVDLLSWLRENCANSSTMQQMADSAQNGDQNKQREPSDLQKLATCYIETEPRHLIVLDGSLAQPIPEHPKREHVFCLSTTFGDAYLFQASCQLDADNWIAAIHNACAASLAREQTRDEAKRLFESRIRRLELEAEKKLFLRQRLESRLSSMCSMGYANSNVVVGQSLPLDVDDTDHDETPTYVNFLPTGEPQTGAGGGGVTATSGNTNLAATTTTTTMQGLLLRLNQQLLALDFYLEQIQCEIYQLRCYLNSCESLSIFYDQQQQQQRHQVGQTAAVLVAVGGANKRQACCPSAAASAMATNFVPVNLPHPRTLLTHVSKPSKLLLIKLGVFTISSFHAYIHARQGSADGLLDKIQTCCAPSEPLESPAKLPDNKPTTQLLSYSISESILRGSPNLDLDREAQQLIDMADLRVCLVRVGKQLYDELCRDNIAACRDNKAKANSQQQDQLWSITTDHQDGSVWIEMKLNASSSPIAIVQRVLSILEDSSSQSTTTRSISASSKSEFEFLHYYLEVCGNKPTDGRLVAKRDEKLSDWPDLGHLNLVQKSVFKLELQRSRLDANEQAAPFGISVGAQLFVGKTDSLLSVYCSYIEWASPADKAQLNDEDELLAINGEPVAHLDMMYIECLIQDEAKLSLVVSSSRQDLPAGATLVDRNTWQPSNDDDDDDEPDDERKPANRDTSNAQNARPPVANPSSRIISDEYISSLVCPPPPTSTNQQQQQQQRGVEVVNRLHETATTSSRGLPTRDLPASPPSATGGGCWPVVSKTPECHIDDSNIERLRKSIMELMETEYTYIQYLETTCEHYLCPLEARNFLDIGELRSLSRLINELLTFHRSLFAKLTSEILASVSLSYSSTRPAAEDTRSQFNVAFANRQLQDEDEDVDKLNRIIELMQSSFLLDHFIGPLSAIIGVFDDEADKFRPNAAYCDVYSRFQKTLHPKMAQNYSRLQSSSIVLLPSSLDHFTLSSKSPANSTADQHQNQASASILQTSFHPQQQQQQQQRRDSLITLTSLASNTKLFQDSYAKSKKIRDFLDQLDSSQGSSSLSSISLSSMAAVDSRKPVDGNEQSSNSASNNRRQQNFESYLIKPIQRIVRYPMLLGAIYSSIPSQSFERDLDCRFRATIKRMEAVASYVNDSQRINDEYGLVFEHIQRQYLEQQKQQQLQARIPGALVSSNSLARSIGAHQPPIDLGSESLLYFSPVEWLNRTAFCPTTTSTTTKQHHHHHHRQSACMSQILFVFKSCVIFICKESTTLSNSSNSSGNVSGASKATRNKMAGAHSGAGGLQKSTSGGFERLAGANSFDIIRYQTLIPVSEVQVRSVPSTSSSSTTIELDECGGEPAKGNQLYRWELFRCSSVNSNSHLLTKKSTDVVSKQQDIVSLSQQQQQHQADQQQQQLQQQHDDESGKVYLLASASSDVRGTFLRNIRATIRDSVRNMNLPASTSLITKATGASRPIELATSFVNNNESKPLGLSGPTSGAGSQELVGGDSSCSQATSSFSPLCSVGSESNFVQLNINGKTSVPSQDETSTVANNNNNNMAASQPQQASLDLASGFKNSIRVNN